MFVIIGIVIVIGAILGGYLMEHGNIRVLLQPAELVIIGGAALGTVLIANPLYILKKIVGGLAGVFGSSKYGKAQYLESLKMLYELFSRARKEGLMALESDSDNPEQSPVFSKYPKFLKDHHALPFVCDTIRMAAGGGAFDDGRRAAGAGDRGGGAGRGDHHGSVGRSAGRDRPQGGGGAGGNFPGYSALLRIHRADCGKHAESDGRGARVLSSNARGDRELYQGLATNDRGGVRTAGNSRQCAADVSRNRKIHQG